MRADERQLILEHLAASESCLLTLVAPLTPTQWAFRESPDRWSIAENIEHLIHFESFITQAIQNALEAGPGYKVGAV
jgi:hypothetical protein